MQPTKVILSSTCHHAFASCKWATLHLSFSPSSIRNETTLAFDANVVKWNKRAFAYLTRRFLQERPGLRHSFAARPGPLWPRALRPGRVHGRPPAFLQERHAQALHGNRLLPLQVSKFATYLQLTRDSRLFFPSFLPPDSPRFRIGDKGRNRMSLPYLPNESSDLTTLRLAKNCFI